MRWRLQGIPYQMVHGVEFFQRKEIKDVSGYLTLLVNPRDDVAFHESSTRRHGRSANLPSTGYGLMPCAMA